MSLNTLTSLITRPNVLFVLLFNVIVSKYSWSIHVMIAVVKVITLNHSVLQARQLSSGVDEALIIFMFCSQIECVFCLIDSIV